VGELVPVDQHEIGRLADRQRADTAAIGGGRGGACCRHAQYLAGARDVFVRRPRNPVRTQYHAHLLQHVAVVINISLVEPDRGIDAALFERIERCDTAAQPEIRAAVMADVGPGRGDAVELGLVEPHPVAQYQPPRKPKRPI
jgi:hypothetical protein